MSEEFTSEGVEETFKQIEMEVSKSKVDEEDEDGGSETCAGGFEEESFTSEATAVGVVIGWQCTTLC